MRFDEIDNTDEIKSLLKLNFRIKGKISIVNGRVDVDGDCVLTSKCNTLPVKFNKVSGGFRCNNNQLTSLQGAPTSVGGSFYCAGNKLTTLEGAPQSVSGDFYCAGNKLTTLEGVPQSVSGDFYCEYDSSLPLLRLLFIKNLKLIRINNAPKDVVNYLNKYIGKGPGGALACAAELARAGFKGNARR